MVAETCSIQKIVSGGQTGVDRAALDVAMKFGIACGGWCPRGRRAADGVIDARYPLQESQHEDYSERTRLNVQDSDATLILNIGELGGGTAYTVEMARQYHKPYLVIALDESPEPLGVIEWVKLNCVGVLNVAGPRDDRHSVVYRLAYKFLRRALVGDGDKLT